MKAMSNGSLDNGGLNRRRFLDTVFGAYAMSAPLGFVSMQLAGSTSRSLTKEQRDKMTPSQVIDELKKGNERFRTGKRPLEIISQQRSSVAGQYLRQWYSDALTPECPSKSYLMQASVTLSPDALQATS